MGISRLVFFYWRQKLKLELNNYKAFNSGWLAFRFDFFLVFSVFNIYDNWIVLSHILPFIFLGGCWKFNFSSWVWGYCRWWRFTRQCWFEFRYSLYESICDDGEKSKYLLINFFVLDHHSPYSLQSPPILVKVYSTRLDSETNVFHLNILSLPILIKYFWSGN